MEGGRQSHGEVAVTTGEGTELEEGVGGTEGEGLPREAVGKIEVEGEERRDASSTSMSPFQHGEITRWTVFIPTNETHTEPSPTPTWASLTTSPSCWSLPIVLCSDATHQRRGPSPCGPVMLSPHCRTVSSAQTGRSSGRQLSSEGEVDLEDYTSAVLGYISKCTEDVTSTRTITEYLNQKPWLNAEVRSLLKARDAAFRSGDRLALRAARRQLTAGVKKGPRPHMPRGSRDTSRPTIQGVCGGA
ncbi:hypothetical protein L3Q82_020002 [Scortum barcoo]|uniref:Uncharacterized protein n=1 Tax=Scortum barcoo TaxID=214431 RepID=A0ACB8VCW4_9TELE|nr:hypothetical protein L3Q82_020002 [Scortum barcoo]